jgi:cytochrome c551/c552
MQYQPLKVGARAHFAWRSALGILALTLQVACGDDASPADTVVGPLFDASSPVVSPDAAPTSTITGGISSDAGLTLKDAGGPASGGTAMGGASDPAWCKAQAVFTKYCVSCHDGEGTAGSPMALKSYADLSADSKQYPGTKIYTRVGTRMHQPANMKPMPPQGTVAPADMKAVDDWIAAGAKGSSAACAGATAQADAGTSTGAELPWPADCEEKFKFIANAGGSNKFRVGAKKEFYQDFSFPAPWTDGNVQAVAFRSITDNKRVLHHWILYQGSAFLVGWSPGKNEKDLPPDIGVYMPGKGNTLKLTVHYNSMQATQDEMDGSGVEVCVTKKPRPKTAFTFPFAANPDIPANAPMTTNSSTCTVNASAPVHLITSSPHMHKRGMGAKFEITRANGMKEVVQDTPFNFEEQLTTAVDFVLNNGDKVTTTCIYKNTGLPATSFGTSTDQEMCFNFALYYPMCGMTCSQSDLLANVWQGTQGNGCPTGGGGLGF